MDLVFGLWGGFFALNWITYVLALKLELCAASRPT